MSRFELIDRLVANRVNIDLTKLARPKLLNDNEITELPVNLGEMSDLDILKLKNNKLESLPESFMNLKWLSGLDLSGNRFKEFPEVLKNLNLYELDISGNFIKEFPKKLKHISFACKT